MPKLPPPIWLEEIQNNAIFNKQRHKLLLEKQALVEKEVKKNVKNSNRHHCSLKEGKDDLEEHSLKENLEDHSLKENSKTESDQEAEAEDLC